MLLMIKVADQKIHVNHKRVASEKLKGTGSCKPSEKQIMELRMESKTCLIQLLEKMLEKCPVSYSLVRHLSCLNPVKMASNKEACSVKFKKVLRLRVKEEECDTFLQKFKLLYSWTAFQFLGQKDSLTSKQLKTEWILSSLNAWQMRATRVFSV